LPVKAYLSFKAKDLNRVNLYDLQRTIFREDNRTGWRRYPLSIQTVFRSNKIKRNRNDSFDLVGVESNPGPKITEITTVTNGKRKSGAKKKGKQSQTRLIVRKPKASTSGNTNVNGYSPAAFNYLKSVLAPCTGNSRIPDMNCLPTALVTVTQDVTFMCSGSGVGGFQFTCNNLSSFYAEDPATTTDAAFTYLAPVNLTGCTTMATVASFARLVSACADTIFTGATLSDAGTITGVTTGAMAGGSETFSTTLAAMLTKRSHQYNRVREGISLFYRPTDSTSFDFKTVITASTYGGLQAHVTGAQGNQVFNVKLTLNYETVINTSTFGPTMSIIPQQNSPVDPVGHARAVSQIASTRPFATHQQALSNNSFWDKVKPYAHAAIDFAQEVYARRNDYRGWSATGRHPDL